MRFEEVYESWTKKCLTQKVLRHTDGTLSIKHGPRRLARYDTMGQMLTNELPIAV